jgi:hypothetical protein
MTVIPDELLETAAQDALRDLNHTPDSEAALDTLTGCDILIPAPDDIVTEDAPHLDQLTLPAFEQPPDLRAVPVFTSLERLVCAFPDISHCRRLRLGLLTAHWPAGDALCLAIDIGHDDSLVFTAEAVRGLLTRPRT